MTTEETITKEQIRELRTSLGLSQEAFAKKLAVDRGTVTRWEAGHRRPNPVSVRQMRRLAKRAPEISK